MFYNFTLILTILFKKKDAAFATSLCTFLYNSALLFS